MKTRLEAFALAGVLALTVVTAGVAFSGMRHSPATHRVSAPVVVQAAPAAASAAPLPHESGDA